MNLKRDQLILLGWLGLGMTIDAWIGPAGYLCAWIVARRFRSDSNEPNQLHDAAALMIGSLVGGWLSGKLGSSGQFFLGHGLAAVQFVRMRRRVSARETWSMMLITLLHLGVVCTTILDIRFLAIFLLAVLLVPRALTEIASTNYTLQEIQNKTGLKSPSVRFAQLVAITGVGILVFVVFPRGAFGSGWRGPTTRGGGGNLLDTMMDPSRSGFANSRRILMQVEAGNLGYLRCFAFTDYDGQIWTRQREGGLILVPPPADVGSLNRLARRTVRVKHVNFLKGVLPTDGRVSRLKGNFFRRSFRNSHQMIEVEGPSQRSHNTYEFWTDLIPKPDPVTAAMRERCLRFPAPGERVRSWLNSVIGSETNLFKQAGILEKHLRENFTYELGAPELNRASVLEDFLFNEKRGHCERFASSLAILLRMQGIPSRVVGGYAPGARNWISGWYDIRFSDAHAWTEAWFEDRGWVQLDATPRAGMTPQADTIGDIFEALDFAWYAHVVNLDAPTQNEVLANVVNFSSRTIRTFGEYWPGLLIVVVLSGCSVLIWRVQPWKGLKARRGLTRIDQHQIEMRHNYDEMLLALHHHGYQRAPSQTPAEFLQSLSQGSCPCLAEITLITACFCKIRYAGTMLSEQEVENSRQALARIKNWSASSKSAIGK